MKSQSTEKGQIVIVFVVALVVLLGLTALAIDGGMVYSERRYAQTVADSSTLAGAGTAAAEMEANGVTFATFWTANMSTAVSQACASAVDLTLANNIQGVTCTALTPDVKHGTQAAQSPNTYASFWDRYIEVHTRITSVTSTAFAHMFFKGPLTSTVDSVTRVKPRTRFAFGYAVASTGSTCNGPDKGGIELSSSDQVLITNGGVFSNSCLTVSGTSSTVKVCMDQNYDADGNPTTCNLWADVQYRDTYSENGNPVIQPAPVDLCPSNTNCVPPMPEPVVPEPNCKAGTDKDGDVYHPGTYPSIPMKDNGNLDGSGLAYLTPGLYCITGSVGLTNDNGKIQSVEADGVTPGGGVTFYILEGAAGNFWKVTGGTLDITAPTQQNAVNGALPGFLVYIHPKVGGDMEVSGGATMKLSGIIYGKKANVSLSGGADDVFNGQIVADFVNVTGNNGFTVNYSGFDPSDDPPVLDLIQ